MAKEGWLSLPQLGQCVKWSPPVSELWWTALGMGAPFWIHSTLALATRKLRSGVQPCQNITVTPSHRL